MCVPSKHESCLRRDYYTLPAPTGYQTTISARHHLRYCHTEDRGRPTIRSRYVYGVVHDLVCGEGGPLRLVENYGVHFQHHHDRRHCWPVECIFLDGQEPDVDAPYKLLSRTRAMQERIHQLQCSPLIPHLPCLQLAISGSS